MAINLLHDKGTPLHRQDFTWRDLVQKPISKLNVDAFTRVRIILMNGIESESLRFSHACARMNKELQGYLARVRRKEQHQQTLVNWLLPADQSPLETTIGYEQAGISIEFDVRAVLTSDFLRCPHDDRTADVALFDRRLRNRLFHGDDNHIAQ